MILTSPNNITIEFVFDNTSWIGKLGSTPAYIRRVNENNYLISLLSSTAYREAVINQKAWFAITNGTSHDGVLKYQNIYGTSIKELHTYLKFLDVHYYVNGNINGT